jgi:hypothetical protein
MKYKIEYHHYEATIGDRWVRNTNTIWQVIKCKKVLWFYQVTLEKDYFREGEF